MKQIRKVELREAQRLWVIIDPESNKLLGARWQTPHYSMMYSLGDFDTAYKCSSRDAAKAVLNVVVGNSQYSLLRKNEIRRLQIRRVRERVIIIDGDRR